MTDGDFTSLFIVMIAEKQLKITLKHLSVLNYSKDQLCINQHLAKIVLIFNWGCVVRFMLIVISSCIGELQFN
jgi:hypothetical protein